MKFSKRLIVTMAVLAAGNSPDFTSAENLRKQSDVTFTTPAGLTLNMDDLNFVRRHLEEKYPGAPTFTFDDLVSAVAKIEPVSYTGEEYTINRGKCIFLLQVIDAKLSELKMDDHFSFVKHYGPSICGTARPTLSPTTDEPTTDSPSKAPTDEPTHQPTDEPSSPPSIGPSLSPTHQPSSPPSIGPSLSPTHQPSSPPSVGPSLSPTHQPSANPITANPSNGPTLTPTSSPNCDGAAVGGACTLLSDCCDGISKCSNKEKYCWDKDPNNDDSEVLLADAGIGSFNCSATNKCTSIDDCSLLGMNNPFCYGDIKTQWCSAATRSENGGTCL